MIFVCCPNCSDCEKAKKWLDDNKVAYTSRDIAKDKPTCDEIKMWQKKSGLPFKEFIKTSKTSDSMTKDMNSMGKTTATTTIDEEICNQLTKDPLLLKCPLAVTDTCVLVGFDEAKWKEKLL